MFKDEVFEELDDISRLVEPFTFSLLEELSEFPEMVEVTFSDVTSGYYGFNEITIRGAIKANSEHDSKMNLHSSQRFLTDCFEFVIEGDGDTFLDLENKKFSQKIFLKKRSTIEEEKLEDIAKDSLAAHSSSVKWHSGTESSRLNEIASIFGITQATKARSKNKKIMNLYRGLQDLFKTGKLNVKSIDLCNNISKWVMEYVTEGNLAAISNLTQVKVMMHSGNPIYSVQEIK
jgi:hypothetical protein